LERSLIYTGLTRAKKLAIFVGQRESLHRSIGTVNMKKRQTSLNELLTINNDVIVKDVTELKN
jgi:exodeoxyribonuclease V alpha subunit